MTTSRSPSDHPRAHTTDHRTGGPSTHARRRPTLPRRMVATLAGPLPRLPAPLDRVAEGWWRLPPRIRLLAGVVVVALALAGLVARSRTSPWGPPTPVLVAATDLAPGDPVTAVPATWPRRLVPTDQLATPPDGVATRPVRAGEVLTDAHVATDRADLLAPDEVALAIERDLGLSPGARVDLLGTDFDGRGRHLGHGRLLAVDEARSWIAVPRDVAPAVAAGLATGQVTIALARGE